MFVVFVFFLGEGFFLLKPNFLPQPIHPKKSARPGLDDMQIHFFLAARRDAVGFSRAGPRTYPDLKVHFQTLDLAGSPRLACKWCNNDMQS